MGITFFHVLPIENIKLTQKFEIFAFFRICWAKMLKPLNLQMFWSEFDKLSSLGSFKLVLHLIGEYNKLGKSLNVYFLANYMKLECVETDF